MREERAAGFILYRTRQGIREYLIVKNKTGGHWGFSKGRVEPGETPEQAARREVAEEVGIANLRPVSDFRNRLAYRFVRQGEPVDKEVLFFLAETDEEGKPQPGEISDMRWLTYPQAIRRVTHREQRELLQRAESFLQKTSGR